MTIIKTKTEENLINSYISELSGELLYTIFAEQARKELYSEIAREFEKLAKEEKEHSNIFKKYLKENIRFTKTKEELKVLCKDTLSNLKFASIGEYTAYEEIYPKYSKIAEEEGFLEIAKLYSSLKMIELKHSELLKNLAMSIENK